MTDAANTRFTTDELPPYAQGNATAFVLATIAYLKRQGLAVDDYVRFSSGAGSHPAGKSCATSRSQPWRGRRR